MKSYYRRFYNDTGLGLDIEKHITNHYIVSIRGLIKEIKTKIKETIQKGVFGEIHKKTKDYEESKLVVFVRTYIIVITCRRYQEQEVATIEDIFIKT